MEQTTQAAKHTPGPWHVGVAGSGSTNGGFSVDEIYVYAPDCTVDDVAVAADIVDPVTGAPSSANARLIAAAPDLLAAANAILICMATLPPTKARVDAVLAMNVAVAKATRGAA